VADQGCGRELGEALRQLVRHRGGDACAGRVLFPARGRLVDRPADQIQPEFTGTGFCELVQRPTAGTAAHWFAAGHWRTRRPCASVLLRSTSRSRSRVEAGERGTHVAPRFMARSKAARSAKTGARPSRSALLSVTLNPLYAMLPVIVTSSS